MSIQCHHFFYMLQESPFFSTTLSFVIPFSWWPIKWDFVYLSQKCQFCNIEFYCDNALASPPLILSDTPCVSDEMNLYVLTYREIFGTIVSLAQLNSYDRCHPKSSITIPFTLDVMYIFHGLKQGSVEIALLGKSFLWEQFFLVLGQYCKMNQLSFLDVQTLYQMYPINTFHTPTLL